MSGLAERYGRASQSSHLEVKPEPCDVDVVIAAGMADSLGTMLMRCRQEWDAQRAAIEQHSDSLLTSRALILMNMPTLRPAAVFLFNLARDRSRQRGFKLKSEAVSKISGNALDLWLDQRCNACQGRGKNGLHGAPQIICNACKGTKTRRRVFPSMSADEHALGEWLLAEMDQVAGNGGTAQRKMSQVLR